MGKHEDWLRNNGLGEFIDKRPPQINGEVCTKYSDPDKGECKDGCPFRKECDPYFTELTKKLQKLKW